jgi:hypothetical protein
MKLHDLLSFPVITFFRLARPYTSFFPSPLLVWTGSQKKNRAESNSHFHTVFNDFLSLPRSIFLSRTKGWKVPLAHLYFFDVELGARTPQQLHQAPPHTCRQAAIIKSNGAAHPLRPKMPLCGHDALANKKKNNPPLLLLESSTKSSNRAAKGLLAG